MNNENAASVSWLCRRTAIALCACLVNHADAEWTVSSLHPAGQSTSEARGGWGTVQVGNVHNATERACMWSGTAASWVNLDPAGSFESMALGASDTHQVGWADVAGRRRASLWAGTAASWVDLNPAGALQSQALGAWGANQVGWMYDGTLGRASLWSGTAESWVDLHPVGASQSEALAVWGGNQVGRVVAGTFHAGMWSGTAESFVDLHPAGAVQSEARGIADGYQVGFADVNGSRRASLWSGTAESWVDLHPAAARSSALHAAYGSLQVGEASVDFNDHASVWSGTAESWVDLHELLSPDFRYSYAKSVSSDGVNNYVAGLGYNVFEGRFEALLWTQPVAVFGCDFSGDGLCDVTDIDLMQSLGPIAAGVPAAGNEQFDLNGDATIDLIDRDQWLADAATENSLGSPYKLGDANLDGVVDGQDFIAWNGAKFTNSLPWSDGDFTADGVVDGQDFIAWNVNKFTSSDGGTAVPEPGTGMLSLVAMLLLGAASKRR